MSKNLTIGDVLDTISITHKFDKDELIFLNTSDILEGKILTHAYMPVSEMKGQAKKTIQNGDILFSEIRPKNKRYAYVDVTNSEDYVVSTKLMVLRNKTKDVLTKYVYYFLTYEDTLNYLQMRAENRICSFPQITFDVVKPLAIKVPSLTEQQKIIDILSALDAKIELNNRINAELENLAKTIYDYWFVQFDFPNADGKPYKSSGGEMVYVGEGKGDRAIPAGWEIGTLRNWIDFKRGISYKSGDIQETGIPLLNLNSFTLEGKFKPEGTKYFNGSFKETSKLNDGDLLIAITDVTRNATIIGKAFVVPDLFKEQPLMSCDVACVISKSNFNNYYLEMLFNSDQYHEYIKHFASGTLVLHLDLNGMLWFQTFMPPKYLLDKFAEFKQSIIYKQTINIKENQQLTQLRDWLLPMLMNGQISIK